MTEPVEPVDPAQPTEPTEPATEPADAPIGGAAPGGRVRLRTLPALAIASILVAAGLLMAIGGMVRLVGPAPHTPAPTVAATPGAATPSPTLRPGAYAP